MKNVRWIGITAGSLSGFVGAIMISYGWSILSIVVVCAVIGTVVGAVGSVFSKK